MHRRPGPTALILIAALVLASCGSDDDGAGETAGGPVVIATTSIWADVVGNVACDGLVEVQTVIPVGADPHGFEPSLADRGRLDDAELVVANGLGLEEGLIDTLEATPTPVFAVADHVATISYATDGDPHADQDGHSDDGDHTDQDGHSDGEHTDQDGHSDGDHTNEDGHSDGEHTDQDGQSDDGEHADQDGHSDGEHADGDDPHIWLDPTRVLDAIDPLADELVTAVGLDADAVAACVGDYKRRLRDLDAEVEARLASVRAGRRALVTNHDSLGYLADRYGYEVVGTVIPAPSGLGATNPAQLEELAQLIEAEGVPAIFSETQHSDADAQALAERVGDVTVVTLRTGTLGESGTGANTYVGLLTTNSELIADALG